MGESTEEALANTPPLYLVLWLWDVEVSGKVEDIMEGCKDSVSLTLERGYCRSKGRS